MRSCATCVLCLREDYGYSNYTVEGTTLECLAGLNPALEGEDETYGAPPPWRDMTPKLAAALDAALTCSRYREGAPATLDADRNGLYRHYCPIAVKDITAELIIEAGYADDYEAATLTAEHVKRHL